MAIVFVHENLVSGEGEGSFESGTSYVRVFDVLTDSYDDNALTVSNAVDPVTSLAIPAAGTFFSKGNDVDWGAVVGRIRCDRNRRYPLLWKVTVPYTVQRPNTADGQWPAGAIDITFTLPRIRIGKIAVSEPLGKDLDGKPIANSAGQWLEPIVEDVYYLKTYEISWYSRLYDEEWWEEYEDTTNAAKVWGRKPGTLLMQGPPDGNRHIDGKGTYWDLKVVIHYNKKGWKVKRPDRGSVKLVAANGSPPSSNDPATGVAPIMNQNGAPTRKLVPLKEGQPLAPGAEWQILEFRVKDPADWSQIGLPPLNVTFSPSS